MSFLKFPSILILSLFLLVSCGKDDADDNDDMDLPDSCLLTDINLKLDETSSLGLMSVAYDNNGQIISGGFQTYKYSYDTEGNVVQALLEGSEFNPEVKFIYTYENGKITMIQEIWGTEPNLEERHVFTPIYSGNFIDKLMRSGLGGDVELDYDFDSNGNALIWTDPTFTDQFEYTFDNTKKGLFEGLTHNQAFAYGIAVAQPFFHFNNAVTSEINYNTDGTIDEASTFSDTDFNVLDFQTLAGSTAGKTYIFEYQCK